MTDPKKAFDFFVEAQVWSFRPLKKYIEKHTRECRRRGKLRA
jgi:hypothetical protein